MSQRAQAAITAAADPLALTHTTLHSGAGHDAQSLAPITDAGMIFIPSRDGISHSPLEYSEWDDCFKWRECVVEGGVESNENNE